MEYNIVDTPVRNQIRDFALKSGFIAVGFAPATLSSKNKDNMTEFIERGYHGDMGWLSAKADLRTFLASPIGVAEHIDYVVTAEKKLEILAHAEDKLESLLKI